jgi:formylglycine-generating enzyme required for sulfatase activity
LTPVADEYAWGNTTIIATTTIENDGTGTDTATGGNCNYDACSPDGPYRAGIFAVNGATRAAAGASYWGIMELSGNVWELTVTVGNTTGRLFDGLHGNGALTAAGEADVSTWPAPSTATGAGFRGGDWANPSVHARASGRNNAASVHAARYYGGRGVRSAPSGVGP